MRARSTISAVLALVATGCMSSNVREIPPPPVTARPTTTTTARDLSTVALDAVPGRTTLPVVDLGPGAASLGGTVVGPNGRVSGATVRVERLVDDRFSGRNVTTNDEGEWRLTKIKGGRYRVRAWKPDKLALVNPQIFFLRGNENRRISLNLNEYSGENVSLVVAPDPPVVGQPANLAVQVTRRSVDSAGVVRSVGVTDLFELITSSSVVVETTRTVRPNSSGRAAWRIRCEQPGTPGITLRIDGVDSYSLRISACRSA